jgi:hypothetical protein
MEYLIPIVIVIIGIGLLLLFLRRPTVVRPPSDATTPKTDAAKVGSVGDEPLKDFAGEMQMDIALGGKHITVKGSKAGWTMTRELGQTSGSGEIVRRMILKGNTGQIAKDLLAKMGSESLPGEAPPEAQLQYPGSSLVVDAFESNRSSAGSEDSRDVFKATLATEADSAQVQAWYRDWLLGHGWQPSPSTETSSDSTQEFARASEHFRLAVADPAVLAPILAVPIPVGTKTVYEVEYSNTSTQPPT